MIELLESRLLLTTLDPTFNAGQGFTDEPFPTNAISEDAVASLAILPGGKILALAIHDVTDQPRTSSLVRYNANGTLDTTFGGGDGILDLNESLTPLAVLKNGHIILVKTIDAQNASIEGRLADGSIDDAFGTHGEVDIPAVSQSDGREGWFLAPTPDGGFYYAVSDFHGDGAIDRLFKFTAAGAFDSHFSGDGQLTIDREATALIDLEEIAVDAQGRLLITDGNKIQRYTTDGSFDESLGSIYTYNSNSRFAIQPDGKIVIASPSFSSGTLALLRVNPDTTIDTTYGSNARFGEPAESAAIQTGDTPIIDQVLIDSQLRATVIVHGTSDGGGDARLIRQNADGSIDYTIAPGGFLDAGALGTPTAAILQPDDELLFGGGPYDIARFADVTRPIVQVGRTVYLTGTAGDDTISATLHTNDNAVSVTVNGQTADFTVDVVSVNALGGNDSVTVDGIRAIIDAGDGTNDITGSIEADWIMAGPGDDVIVGNGGDDTIQAGDGVNDITCAGDRGSYCSIIAGSGNDFVRMALGACDTGDGNDTILGINDDAFKDIGARQINSGDGDDSITTGDANDHVFDDGGVNRISTGGGVDHVVLFTTATATSTVDTGEGRDFAYVTGNYNVTLGDGNDYFIANEVPRADLGPGNDFGRAFSDALHSSVIIGGDGDDNIYTGDGNDSIYGGAGRDTVHAGYGNDLISGGGGNDHLFGQFGRDRLYGGRGNDRLVGGDGNDRLIGGFIGVDTLEGGAGRDTAIAADASDILSSIEL